MIQRKQFLRLGIIVFSLFILFWLEPSTQLILGDLRIAISEGKYADLFIIATGLFAAYATVLQLLLHRIRSVRTGFASFFLFLTVYGYIQHQLTGHPFIPFDASLVLNEPNFFRIALEELAIPTAAKIYIPILLAAVCVFAISRSPVHSKARILLLVPLTLSILFIANRFVMRNISHFPSIFSIPLGYTYALIKLPYYGERREPNITYKDSTTFKKIVLIIDESVTASSLSINNPQVDSTPFLSTLSLTNFKTALSSWNCSSSSNLILRTGIHPRGYGILPGKIMQVPTLFSYAKAAGYRTGYFIGLKTRNYLSSYDKSKIDLYFEARQIPCERSGDCELAEELVTFLNSSEQAFAVIVKKGSHIPYNESYPSNKAQELTSQTPFTDLRFDRDGDYLRSIRWNVDYFFKYGISPILDRPDVFLIYTSDHGQAFDTHSPITHCRGFNPSDDEFRVPLFIIANDAATQARLSRKKAGHATHFDIFPTLLTALGFQPDKVKEVYGPSLFDDLSHPPLVSWGSLFGNFESRLIMH